MTIHFPGDGDPVATVARLRALAADLESMTVFMPNTELDDAPILDDWSMCMRPIRALTGWTTGHPLLGSREVVTSELFAIDAGGRWARTYSRFYRLGRPAKGTETER